MNTINNGPPYDEQAESALLGSILKDNASIDDIQDRIRPEMFFLPAHQLIYSAMVDLYKQEKPIDEVLIHGIIKGKSDNPGINYISELFDYSPESENISHYVDIVVEKFTAREYLRINHEGNQNVENPEQSINESLSKLTDLQASMKVDSGLHDMRSIMVDVAADTEHAMTQKGSVGYETGFADLDKMTYGLQKQELTVIGARPSAGKSALFLNMAYKIARDNQDETVLIFSLEMSKKQLGQRMQSFIGRIDLSLLRTPNKMSQDDFDKMVMATHEIERLPMLINDDSVISIERIYAICRQFAKKNKISTIFIDYLGKLEYEGTSGSEEIRLSKITNIATDIAKKLDCPVVLLSQLNRGLEARTDKRPIMADLKGSGAIEADAHVIMFIYRDSMYNDTTNDDFTEILIRKNRSGQTGMVKLTWQGKFTKFSNYYNEKQYD